MNAGTYIIEFERIGRNKSVPPMKVTVAGEDDLTGSIREYARPHLRSRDFDVILDESGSAGCFACGMHNGGNFSITPKSEQFIDYGPAMKVRHHDKGYPFGNRVPKRVRMTRTVTSDFLPGTAISVTGDDPLVAVNKQLLDAWTNSYGAVAVYMPNGKTLGVKPGEFEVVDWHQF
jgi:hypothetical protein